MSRNNSSPSSRNGSNASSSSRSPLERKEALRTVLAKTRAIHDVNAETVKNLEDLIKQTDVINMEATMEEKATCQDEIVMDSEIMHASSKVIKMGSESLTKELSPYDSRDFAARLLSYIHMLPDATIDKPNWSVLEDEVTKIFRRTPNFSTLSGCLEPLAKKVVVKRQPVKRDAQAPTRRPQAIVTIPKDENSLEQTVQKIRLLISECYKETKNPIDYFRLILHPSDFGKTIENMLHVSFLVRDGIIKMMLDGNGNLVIEPCSKEMRNQAKKTDKKINVQNVMSLNIQQWRILNEAYKITQPMINFQ